MSGKIQRAYYLRGRKDIEYQSLVGSRLDPINLRQLESLIGGTYLAARIILNGSFDSIGVSVNTDRTRRALL